VLGDRVLRGDENNSFIRAFYIERPDIAMELARHVYHRINCLTNFRKELTETMTIVQSLGNLIAKTQTFNICDTNMTSSSNNIVPNLSTVQFIPWGIADEKSHAWHIIDLCCGKSLTAAIVALVFSQSIVTCVDKCDPNQLPHYMEAGLGDRVQYLQVDILDISPEDKFIKRLLHAVHERPRLNIAIVGVHCCGSLSIRAIEAFKKINAKCILLIPCCMPRKQDKRYPCNIFTSRIQSKQYEAWANYLKQQLSTTATASCEQIQELLSKKNILVSAEIVRSKNYSLQSN